MRNEPRLHSHIRWTGGRSSPATVMELECNVTALCGLWASLLILTTAGPKHDMLKKTAVYVQTLYNYMTPMNLNIFV